MPKDKFSATWVSHSSISDFLKCPRSYYLNNVYKDSKTGNKVTIINPYLALGQVVHNVIEALSIIPTKDRFSQPLLQQFERQWEAVSGEKGGFMSDSQEKLFKDRGKVMLNRVINKPGPLKNLAVKINMDLPHYWLSEEEEIILCGKIDWLEYLPDIDKVHIIDFKTSKREEDPNSLQLPIYLLLVNNCQKREVEKASYWYLDFQDDLLEKDLPDPINAHEQVLKLARQVKLARKLEKYDCPKGKQGCFACQPFEQILRGEAKFVGTNDFRQDTYILPSKEELDSIIL